MREWEWEGCGGLGCYWCLEGKEGESVGFWTGQVRDEFSGSHLGTTVTISSLGADRNVIGSVTHQTEKVVRHT